MKMLEQLQEAQKKIAVTGGSGEPVSMETASAQINKLLSEVAAKGKKIIFIGNGGSAAISSHMAVDFWKNGEVEAVAFNDASLLTCISNDYSYEEVFAKPVEKFAKAGDLFVPISSSGKSKNILRGTEAARAVGCRVVSFSGFQPVNPLRKMGELNFYVPSTSYGVVESLHLAILHALLEGYMGRPPGSAR